MNRSADYKVILFDLGGVLLELRDPISTFGLDMDATEFHRTWTMLPSVRSLESGQINGEEFARRVVAEMGLPIGWRELLDRFDSWPGEIYPEAVELLRRIPSRYSCAILSNTNSVHWKRIDVPGHFGDRFDRFFLSYQSGLLKPDRGSFLQVSTGYGCRPQEILFFDDNPLNVDAARREGFSAIRIQGPSDLETALIGAGVI